MNILTLSAAKTTVARALGKCSTDSDVVTLINEAQQRLLNRPGTPVGAMMRYRFCSDDNCVVLPRQIVTVIKAAWCNVPARIMPEWYDFDLNGPGQLDNNSWIKEAAVDRGRVCCFDDITYGQTDRKIQVTSDVAESGTYIWLYGYDENGNWIRTNDGGTWIDGEKVTIPSATSVLSTNYFTSLIRVHKDATNGPTRLYEYDTGAAAVHRAMAIYEPSETDPVYRKVMFPDLTNYSTCCDDNDTENKAITLLVRLRHIPVSADNDALVVGNVAAIKLMAMSIQAEEEQRYDDAMRLQVMAQNEIDGELAAYLGDGVQIGLSVEHSDLFGAGGVENVI